MNPLLDRIVYEVRSTTYLIVDFFAMLLGIPFSMTFGYNFTDSEEVIAQKKAAARVELGLPAIPVPSKYLTVRILSQIWNGVMTGLKWAFCALIYTGLLEFSVSLLSHSI